MGQYTRINVANNGQTELDSSITDTDTTVSVLDASVFAEAPIQVTLVDSNGNLEIVEVGNVDEENDNLEDVSRGVDGTTAQSFDTGSLVEDRFNRGTYNELVGENVTQIPYKLINDEEFLVPDRRSLNVVDELVIEDDAEVIVEGEGRIAIAD